MRRVVRALVSAAACVAVAAVVAARPHVVERYALYLGSASAPGSARLYLDPFPDAVSCESRVRLFRANAEAAFCSARRELAFGRAADALLAADFARLSLGGASCAVKRTRIARR